MSFAQVLSQAAACGKIEIAQAPRDGRAAWAHLSDKTTAPVAHWLEQHLPFRAISGQVLIRSNATEVVLSSSAAMYLTERAIEFGPDAVAASFNRVMSGMPITHAKVVVVKGLSARSIVRIAPGLTVEPIACLMNVDERAHAFAVGSELNRDNGVPTAIVMRIAAKPQYSPRPIGSDLLLEPPCLSFPTIQVALDAISLVAGAAVEPNISYDFVEEIGWPTMIAGSIGGSYPVNRVVELDAGQAPALQNLAGLLSAHSRGDALTRAMQKLRDAQRRTNDAERALDLGACLEILLMHGEGADNAEIGHKLRMRAAWLVGKDPADRQRIHDIVKLAYNARSKVAHTGVLPAPKSEAESDSRSRNLRDTEHLCQSLIAHILRGGWPNWTNTVLQI